ncbi:MAG: C4-dicarboxylate transporter [Myxococcales bacterium]|nr:C4-dicarboxylate transporter [Myxococcales bacterium]
MRAASFIGRAFGFAIVLLAATTVQAAETVTLRLATIAPEGSAWARELGAYARDVESGTHGAVRIKIYYSGIAGDEATVLNRIKRDQLDGAVASESCLQLAPSMRVTRIVGIFRSRQESAYVMTRLKPLLDAEFLKSGFVHMGTASLGPEVLFTRAPVRTMAELRATRLWVWDLDAALRLQTAAMGLRAVPRPIEQAGRAYDEGATDGFIAVPSATLAFQWSAQAHYVEDLRFTYRAGCVFYASRVFDALPIEAQRYVVSANAKLRVRIDDLGRTQDEALMGGLFARQGVKAVPVSERFRAEFFDLARDVRGRGDNRVVDDALISDVLSWLADYRVEHAP